MKSVFYTSVTGPNNGYVHDVSAMQHPAFDFVAIHDSHHQSFPGWKSINIDESYPYDKGMYAHKQRYPRMLPHLFFSEYEYSVYLDPKWELTTEFLDLCAAQIARQKSWLMPIHPKRENLVQEILFPFCNGSLSLDECKYLIDKLVEENVDFSKFFPSLTGWLIRQHNDVNREIGERWFDLLMKCYENNTRDQIVFPFAVGDESLVERSLHMAQFAECGVKLNYPNQVRIKKVDWQSQINDLLRYFRETTGVYTKLYPVAE